MSKELREARAEAQAARSEVIGTLGEIRQRLAPRTIAEEAWEGVCDRSAQIAEDAVELAKARPVATAAVALAAVGLLARHTLADAASSLFARRSNDDEISPPPLDGV